MIKKTGEYITMVLLNIWRNIKLLLGSKTYGSIRPHPSTYVISLETQIVKI